MPQSIILSADIWLQILNRLDYFDLCSMKRVSKLLNECCKIRSVQENLFVAPYQEFSVQSKFQAGKKKVELHPVFFHCLYLLEESKRVNSTYGTYHHGEFQVKKIHGAEWKKSDYNNLNELESVIRQNATNPPLFRFRLFARNWSTDTLRNFFTNNRSRTSDAASPQSNVSPSTSSFYSQVTGNLKFEVNTPLIKSEAVTVGDILRALSIYLEEIDPNFFIQSLRWESMPFSYGLESDEKRLQKCEECKGLHPHDFYYDFDSDGVENGDEEAKHKNFVEETFCLVEESSDEDSKPLCSCWKCQNVHPWNEKCWEKFVKREEDKAEADRKDDAAKCLFSALVFCQTKAVPELKLHSKDGLVADLDKSLEFAE